jgi:3-phosphoshikimate 1-carboxyvinyltransferase
LRVIVKPSGISGIAEAPASKSSTQRAFAAALVRKGESLIIEPGDSEDEKAAASIIQKLGADVSYGDNEITITSNGVKPVDHEISCGESGLAMRMFVPVAALSDQAINITGSGSLIERPMALFDEVFPKLNVEIQSAQGKLPLIIKGPLVPADIMIDGSLSSQFLTGLIIAFSASAAKARIEVNYLKSKPYIDLTLAVLKHFDLPLPENRNYEEFIFNGAGVHKTDKITYHVEKDWSNGAFLLVAGAIAGPVTVKGLDAGSAQGDKAVLDALFKANANIAIEAKGIKIRPSEMDAFEFDARDCPDLFPPLAVLALNCKGISRILGVNRLLHKESNRALSLVTELSKMGAQLDIENDSMIITGGGRLNGAEVDSHNDHRIAMALTIAGLNANGKTIIHHAEAVRKSCPRFYDDLKLLGASLSLRKDE